MKTIELTTADGSVMPVYVSLPKGNGIFPALLVLQEAFGVNQHIRNVADRFAKEGFVAVAPELFHRTAPGFECGYTEFAKAAPHMQAITSEGLTDDLKTTFDWLQQQENIAKENISSIGYCLGGRVSFLANAVLPLSAAVSYYGGGTHTFSHRANELHAPHLFFWGGLDKHISTEHIRSVVEALDAAGKEYVNTVISYADHGFNCDDRASYNAVAANQAWALTLAFLRGRMQN